MYVEHGLLVPLRTMAKAHVDCGVMLRVVEKVSTEYHTIVVGMLNGAKKTEASLQRMKKTAGNIAQMAGGGLSSATEGVGVSSSGLNKIRQQVACDVKSYIKEVRLILPQEANCSCLESFEKYVVGGLL